MNNFAASSPTVTNCTFNGNTGSGIHNFNGPSPTVTNCIFFDNASGMNNSASWPTVTNCTFIGNIGGMNNFVSSPTVTNCIFWANVHYQISAIDSSMTVTYCDVQGGYPGTGNIHSPPLLDGSLHLLAGSPCIDAGNNSALLADTADLGNDGDTTEPIPYDYRGNPRRFDDPATPDTGLGTPPILDIGADEYIGTSDLRLTKTVNNNTPDLDETITFTIVLSNDGPDSATNIKVTDLLPAGLGYVPPHNTTQGTYDPGTGIWAVGDLANGASAQLDIIATVDEEGAFLNLAQVVACDQADPDSAPNNYDEDDQALGVVTSLAAGGYQDTMPPCGSIHAYDNMLRPPNKKMVDVTLSGYVRDELSIVRDVGGIGVSEAYLLVNGEMVIPLEPDVDGKFSVTQGFKAEKGSVYTIELYASDTNPVEDGGPNVGLVDQTYIRVP